MKRMQDDDGFIAALDQSGGSSKCTILQSQTTASQTNANDHSFSISHSSLHPKAPGALRLFGIQDDDYIIGEKSMFDQIHYIRTRIISSPKFNANHGVIGAILFDDTIKRNIEGLPSADYLWKKKCIVPFLKIDKGLEVKKDGVELMKTIPNLNEICVDAVAHNIFGTKMRSVIHSANRTGIKNVVTQQFEVAKQIIANGLVPIIEPEVSIESHEKCKCEELLLAEIIENVSIQHISFLIAFLISILKLHSPR